MNEHRHDTLFRSILNVINIATDIPSVETSLDVLQRRGFLRPGMLLFGVYKNSKPKRYGTRFNIHLKDSILGPTIKNMEKLKKRLALIGMNHFRMNFFKCSDTNLNIFGEIDYINTKCHRLFMRTILNINSYDCLAYFFFFCYD